MTAQLAVESGISPADLLSDAGVLESVRIYMDGARREGRPDQPRRRLRRR